MEREIRWSMWWNDGRLFNFQRTIKNTCCWMFWLLCAKTHIIHLCTHFSSLALSTRTTIAAWTQQPMRCDFDIRFIFNSGSIHQFKSNQRPVIAVTTPTCWLCLCTTLFLSAFFPSLPCHSFACIFYYQQRITLYEAFQRLYRRKNTV